MIDAPLVGNPVLGFPGSVPEIRRPQAKENKIAHTAHTG